MSKIFRPCLCNNFSQYYLLFLLLRAGLYMIVTSVWSQATCIHQWQPTPAVTGQEVSFSLVISSSQATTTHSNSHLRTCDLESPNNPTSMSLHIGKLLKESHSDSWNEEFSHILFVKTLIATKKKPLMTNSSFINNTKLLSGSRRIFPQLSVSHKTLSRSLIKHCQSNI